MSRRWQSDPYFEKYVHQFYEAVAIPDRTKRDAEIRRLMATFKRHKVNLSSIKKLDLAARKVNGVASPKIGAGS